MICRSERSGIWRIGSRWRLGAADTLAASSVMELDAEVLQNLWGLADQLVERIVGRETTAFHSGLKANYVIGQRVQGAVNLLGLPRCEVVGFHGVHPPADKAQCTFVHMPTCFVVSLRSNCG